MGRRAGRSARMTRARRHGQRPRDRPRRAGVRPRRHRVRRGLQQRRRAHRRRRRRDRLRRAGPARRRPVATAVLRTAFGRTGIYDVTVRRGDEVVAEFRGRSHRLAPDDRDPARAVPATTSSRCSPSRSRSSTSAATTARPWRTCRSGSASASRRSTTTCTSKDELLRMAIDRALDGLFDVLERDPPPRRAGDRQARAPRARQRRGAAGPAAVRDAAAARPRQHRGRAGRAATGAGSSTATSPALVRQAEADGDIRPDVDPDVTARLLFGMVNSLIEWYRPAHSDLADAVCAIAFDGLRQREDVTMNEAELLADAFDRIKRSVHNAVRRPDRRATRATASTAGRTRSPGWSGT